MSLNDVFHGITTPIRSDFGAGGIGDGTGFFYHFLEKSLKLHHQRGYTGMKLKKLG
jgi:hypothetical protein